MPPLPSRPFAAGHDLACGGASAVGPVVRLDAAGFAPADLDALGALLQGLGARQGLRLQLASDGDVLLLEVTRSLDLPTSAMQVLRAGRPTLLVFGAALRSPAGRARERASLLAQLAELPGVRAQRAANEPLDA